MDIVYNRVNIRKKYKEHNFNYDTEKDPIRSTITIKINGFYSNPKNAVAKIIKEIYFNLFREVSGRYLQC
jgi:hypothetical protein